MRTLLSSGADGRRALCRARVLLAKADLASDAPREAVLELDLALAADPDCAEAFALRCDARLRLGQRADALADYRRAAALGETKFPARVHAALGDALMSDFDDAALLAEASAHFDAAIRLSPNSIDHHAQAGTAFYYAGRHTDAAAAWSRAIAEKRARAAARGLDKLGARFLGESWLASVGHLGKIDYYVKMGLLGLRPPHRTVAALRPGLKIPNRFLLEQWRGRVEIVDDPAALGLSRSDAALLTDEFNALDFADGTTRSFHAAAVLIQRQWEQEKRPALLRLSDDDEARGRDCLAKLGMPRDAWFVALHVREPGYWSGIDREHPGTRDADVETYLPAIRAITKRGGWVVRTGDPSMRALPAMERVIDYARSPLKSDWMDVFLWASCRFFLGTTSGPIHVPPAFGVPCVCTNWAVLARPSWYGADLWIPKLAWSRKERRLLRFDEIFSAGLGHMEWRKRFDDAGVDVKDNTPEEIEAVTREMLDRLDGSSAPGDDAVQDDYRRMAGTQAPSRLGRDFIRRHADLFKASEDARQSEWTASKAS